MTLDAAHLSIFYANLPEREALGLGEVADYFAYYLQVELGRASITTAEIKECFRLSDLSVPSWIATHLTNNSKGREATYVKAERGYRLHARARERISGSLGSAPAIVQANTPLRKLYEDLPDGPQKSFLKEAIDCYSMGCNRSAVVMFWLFLMDHLYQLVIKNHLHDFNSVLSKNNDKRVKVTSVSKWDDFGEIPEGKFIEFLRSADIITSDVRKILDQKLGTRNTAAHPSTVTFKQSKANEFLEDLFENVYLKYPAI